MLSYNTLVMIDILQFFKKSYEIRNVLRCLMFERFNESKGSVDIFCTDKLFTQ